MPFAGFFCLWCWWWLILQHTNSLADQMCKVSVCPRGEQVVTGCKPAAWHLEKSLMPWPGDSQASEIPTWCLSPLSTGAKPSGHQSSAAKMTSSSHLKHSHELVVPWWSQKIPRDKQACGFPWITALVGDGCRSEPHEGKSLQALAPLRDDFSLLALVRHLWAGLCCQGLHDWQGSSLLPSPAGCWTTEKQHCFEGFLEKAKLLKTYSESTFTVA